MHTHVPLRSILLATNLTDIEWLFPFTCSLAEHSGAHITVLHVISAINGFSIDLAGYPYYDPRDAMAAVKQQLEGFCSKTCAARIKAEVVALDGTPARQILAMANDVQADLVVMGTRAHRGIDKWMFGSVAESVLRSSSIPVVTVGPNARRAAASGRPIKSILFATSLMAHATDTANVDLMLKWTERLQGHLTLLHVLPDHHKHGLAEEQDRKLREGELHALVPERAFQQGEVEAQVRTGRPSREILAAGAHFDLITLGAQDKPVLGRLAPEGTLYQVLAEAHCPVATLHSAHTKAAHA
jgi:nucleotide-binding universal stress UspA family protein